ncbi:MAG: HAMP domain-containing sensor histidine kinase [Ferruginibacter sp.]
MSKLLTKPFKAFTIYALIILACSIPVYYLVVDFIWLNELDEHNQIVKERIEEGFKNISITENELNSLLMNWGKLQPGITIAPDIFANKKADSIYTLTKLNKISGRDEVDRFRGLSTYINIQGKYYHLQIETNIEETNETILAITIVTIFFFVLLVIGFIILNKQIARKIWSPFQNTLGKIRSFDLAKRERVSFDKTGIEEFEELNNSLQKLIDKNISAYDQQKTFIENASHELQTPLAVLRSKMELLLQNKDISKEQLEILAAIELPISRMSRINKNLLILAKIENNQFADIENLELTDVINETLELLGGYISEKQITVDKKITSNTLIVCNRMLLEILISNLLINAIVHNVEGGNMQIELANKTLTVLNTGKDQINSEKLFERFAISSSQATNSGLGLAIVKEICSRYQWQVNYSFKNNTHSFSVAF